MLQGLHAVKRLETAKSNSGDVVNPSHRVWRRRVLACKRRELESRVVNDCHLTGSHGSATALLEQFQLLTTVIRTRSARRLTKGRSIVILILSFASIRGRARTTACQPVFRTTWSRSSCTTTFSRLSISDCKDVVELSHSLPNHYGLSSRTNISLMRGSRLMSLQQSKKLLRSIGRAKDIREPN